MAADRMPAPYYADDLVTLYHGDCREIAAWLDADVLVTDPPYGISYDQSRSFERRSRDKVTGDTSTGVRDAALALWGDRPALVFGTWQAPRPKCNQLIVWDKGDEAAMGHPRWWAAHEEIYVRGNGWLGPRSPNVIRCPTLARSGSERRDLGHPTPKPVTLMETLLRACPPGVVADPFAGSGATLVAARNLGRRSIGVEIEQQYCALIVRRLSQRAFDFGEAS